MKIARVIRFIPYFIVFCVLPSSSRAQVTSERLLHSSKEPQNWLMYSGDYAGRRFSALDQINVSNAATLVPKWAYQTIAGGKFEATPLVVDGILYGTGQDDRVYALDARSGRPIWQYQQTLPADIRPCCGRVNRRSEEHTSELQSRGHLVCRLLLEKKKNFVDRYSSWRCDRRASVSLPLCDSH